MPTHKSYYIYVNSKNRDTNEKIYNFNVNLNNPIKAGNNQGINLSIVSFSMLNTDYNIKSCYFRLDLVRLSDNQITSYTYNIPDGNYSYLTFLDYLNSVLVDKVKVEYLKHRNAYKFTSLISTTYDIYILPQNSSKYLGLNNQITLATYSSITYEGSYINLSNYSHIIIKSNTIIFDDITQENINNIQMGCSSILFMIDKQDIPPFHLITYNNNNTDSYSINIANRYINSIDFKLYDEKGNFLTDTSDYFLVIKVVIFEIEVNDNSVNYLDDIKFLLMSLMFNKNLTLK